MNVNELAKELMYFSSNCIYVVTWNNILKKVFTPFRTIVYSDVGQLSKGQIVTVEKIKITIQLKTVFVVDGKAYYHYHFGFIVE
jgi:hypothetical protein